MPHEISAITVLVASPSDTQEARDAVRDQIFQWSINAGLGRGVVALPWLYERNAIPAAGDRPQALINEQAVDEADVVVAFFNSRLGTDTGLDVSGTAEEIRNAQGRGRPVHVYFSDEPRPRDIDLEQAAALERFRTEIRESVLSGSYNSATDLAQKVTSAIERDVQQNGWDNKIPPMNEASTLQWRHVKERSPNSRGKMVTKRSELVVTNPSPTAVEGLVFKVTGAPRDSNGKPAMRFEGPTEPVTVHGESEKSWRFIALRSFEATIDANWTQNGRPYHQTRTTRIEGQ